MVKKKIIHSLGPLIGLLLFAAALWMLRRELKEYSYHDVMRSLEELPALRLYIALALTLFNYFVMTGYDSLALRYIRSLAPVPEDRPCVFHRLCVQYQYWTLHDRRRHSSISTLLRVGIVRPEITKVIAFYTLALWLGLFSLSGTIFLIEPVAVPSMLHLPFYSLRPLGVVLLAPACGYLLLCTLRKRPLKIGGWNFSLPSMGLSLSQIAVASLDYALAGSVLFVLLSYQGTLSYPGFLPIFLIAQIAGSLSQIPGGLGVFETLILTLLAPNFPIHSLLGSLLAYRAIYYLLPLSIAAVSLGVHEVLLRKVEIKKTALVVGRWIPVLLPNVFAFAIFVAGAILLFSRVTPAVSGQLTWLSPFLSLPVIEISHFLGSLVGVGLLFLARGLQRRLDGAYLLTLALLAAGIIFSLLKGFEFKMALVLAVMFGALLPSRHHFYRKASLIGQRFTSGWMIAIIVVLLCSAWLGIFSYKNITYSDELWWQFALMAMLLGFSGPPRARSQLPCFSH